MKKYGLSLFVLFAFQCSIVFAQTAKTAEIKRIDAYHKTVVAFANKYKNPHLIYADTSDYSEGSKPDWRKFATQKELDKFREQTETYTIAYNWRRNGALVESNFTFFSPSGDWAEYVFHYFRTDGSLAKVEAETRTFNGNLLIIQDFYFDSKGNPLKKTIRYTDLTTRKPIKATKKFLESRGSFSSDIKYYKTTAELPFAELLKN